MDREILFPFLRNKNIYVLRLVAIIYAIIGPFYIPAVILWQNRESFSEYYSDVTALWNIDK